MAYFFYSDSGPNSVSILTDDDKSIAASTETLEEYLVSNRFGMAPDRINISNVIYRCLTDGYKANVRCLYYKKELPVIVDKMLKYDGLPTQGIRIPILKERVLDIFKKYCSNKIQILDVVIILKDGTEIHDYKALNVINRVEAFTWEGSKKAKRYEEYLVEEESFIKKDFNWIPEPTRKLHRKRLRERYEKYGNPNALSMDVLAYKSEVVEREIICRDSVTRSGIMICEELGQELLKHKFKGLRLDHDTGDMKFV